MTVIQPSDRISDVIEVHHLLVDRMFNSRTKSTHADDRTHIEEGSGNRRHPNATGPVHHILIVNSTTPMHNYAI